MQARARTPIAIVLFVVAAASWLTVLSGCCEPGVDCTEEEYQKTLNGG